MSDVIDFGAYRAGRTIVSFTVPAPQFRAGDMVRDSRYPLNAERSGIVTQYLGYSQRSETHCYNVRAQRLTFFAHETNLVPA